MPLFAPVSPKELPFTGPGTGKFRLQRLIDTEADPYFSKSWHAPHPKFEIDW